MMTGQIQQGGWFAAWTAAQMITGTGDESIDPHLRKNTIRQQIQPSIGGDRIRLTLSNEYGIMPAVFESVSIARLIEPDRNAIDPLTNTVITFAGLQSVELPAGETVTSDAIDFSFDAFADIAITMKIGEYAGGTTTGHTDALCSTWIGKSPRVHDASFDAEMTTENWYFISKLDIWTNEDTRTLVVIGDSITDCYGARANRHERWSDVLSRRLANNFGTKSISVVNEGIGGNAIFGGNYSVALKDRFNRDVLGVPGVRYAVVLIGINDIGCSKKDISVNMIEEFGVMIEKCHANDIEIYAGTIMPVKGHSYYTDLHEQTRRAVNQWIRSDAARFDGTIDFDRIMADRNDPSCLSREYSLDGLHCNSRGYQRMGEYAYERLKEIWCD